MKLHILVLCIKDRQSAIFLIGSNCIPTLVHNPRSYCQISVHWETTATTAVTVDQSEPSLVDPLALIGQQ